MIRVAFQGEPGAFSEEAVLRFFGRDVEPVPRRDFAEVGRAVADQQMDFGLLPIENSLAGSVVGSYDVLAAHELKLVGEVIAPIHHCVLGLAGASLDRIERILSHPVALAQCTRFLRSLPAADSVAVYDTAGAAKEVAQSGDAAQAAIASTRAARRYGLSVLAENVEDRHDNQTRFLVIARKDAPEPLRGLPARRPMPTRSALLVDVANTPGALLRILSPFAQRGINLSKLESRPAAEPWTYRFFVEFDADIAGDDAASALDEVAGRSVRLQVLGTFPRWSEDFLIGG